MLNSYSTYNKWRYDLNMEQIEKTEKYILAAVSCGDEEAAWDSLDELAELVRTAGAETCFMTVQNLPHPDRAFFPG